MTTFADKADAHRSACWAFFFERLGLDDAQALAAKKRVPIHRTTIFYFLGGMALFLFGIQVATGILLSLYYKPSPDQAFESVRAIMTEIDFGWLIRSIHVWSANLLIGVLFLHILTTYMMRAYRGPREITWMTGVLLLVLFLAFGFSGYLLPWNQLAFFATRVGTAIVGVVPWVGKDLLLLARSGENVTGDTLARFYALHVVILPLCRLCPARAAPVPGAEARDEHPRSRGQAARRRREGADDAVYPPFPPAGHGRLVRGPGHPGGLGGAVSLGTRPEGRPLRLGPRGDQARVVFPLHVPDAQETAAPHSSIFEWLEGEVVGVLFFGFCGLVVLVVPFLDFGAARGRPRRVLNVLAALAVVFFIVMTARGLSDTVDGWFAPLEQWLLSFLS